MPTFRITLNDNLPTRAPSAFEVIYTFATAPTAAWPLTNVHPDREKAVIHGDCVADLVNQPNVRTRTLRAHYPTNPNQMDIQISSVQR